MGIIFIGIGAYIYWSIYGFTVANKLTLGFYFAALFMIIGLVLLLKRADTKS